MDDDGLDRSDLEVRNTAVSQEPLSASFSSCKQQSYTREEASDYPVLLLE